jgi:hypothetical protein
MAQLLLLPLDRHPHAEELVARANRRFDGRALYRDGQFLLRIDDHPMDATCCCENEVYGYLRPFLNFERVRRVMKSICQIQKVILMEMSSGQLEISASTIRLFVDLKTKQEFFGGIYLNLPCYSQRISKSLVAERYSQSSKQSLGNRDLAIHCVCNNMIEPSATVQFARLRTLFDLQ